MDGPIYEHSDSDSGESWTILDNNSEETENNIKNSEATKKFVTENNHEKDEDTDGISIISESETETPPSFLFESVNTVIEDVTTNDEIPLYKTTASESLNIKNVNSNEANISIKQDSMEDILGDNNKHKIYVHRRNNRLSTVLNIMMLMSILTAAGVAIGHMWGAKNECSQNTKPSLNNILSDLYKLQEENFKYQNKLLELALFIENKFPSLCEKESGVSVNTRHKLKFADERIDKLIKCITERTNKRTTSTQTEYANEVLKRPKRSNQYKKSKDNTYNISKLKAIKEKDDNSISKECDFEYKPNLDKSFKVSTSQFPLPREEELIEKLNEFKYSSQSKTSFENSMKLRNFNNIVRQNIVYNKKSKDNFSESSVSEADLTKDNRYISPKHKLERKKHDRTKSNKEKKRRNKFENWDLKEGVLKYYDDLSQKLLQTHNFIQNKINIDNDKVNKELNKRTDEEQNNNKTYNNFILPENPNPGEKLEHISNWYDSRARLRKEARKRHKRDLLTQSIGNTSQWYFRRMRKREQCRVKDKCTPKKTPNKKNP